MRTAPIVCPEESPQCARRRIALPPVGLDAPTPAREQGLQPYGALDCFGWRSEGDWGRAESPPVRPQAHTPALPPAGPDAPTPAREQGLQPYGALTLFFRWRKKSVQKKASGTATPGKSPLLPILTAGLAMSRAAELASYACYRARSELAFFRRQNGRAFFPPLPIAALLPRSRRGANLPLAGGTLRYDLDIFASQKASVVSNPCWPF